MKIILLLILSAFTASAATLYPVMSDNTNRTITGGTTNLALLNGTNTFTGTNIFSGPVINLTAYSIGTTNRPFRAFGTNGTSEVYVDKDANLFVPDGSVTSPSVSFSSYPTTGIYSDNLIRFAVNGGLVMSVWSAYIRADVELRAEGGLKVGGSGTLITSIVSATATLDFGSILATASEEKVIAVTGAVVGNPVIFGPPAAILDGAVFNYWVASNNYVNIRCNNAGSIAIDPASATYRVTVVSH